MLLLCNKQHGVKDDCLFITLCMPDFNIICQWMTLFSHLGSMRLMSSYEISVVTYSRNISNMRMWNTSYIKTCSSFLFYLLFLCHPLHLDQCFFSSHSSQFLPALLLSIPSITTKHGFKRSNKTGFSYIMA